MAKFYEGEKLAYIRFNADGTEYLEAGSEHPWQVSSIVVEYEDGPMSKIPWAIVTYYSGRVEKYNLATVCGVGITESSNG